MSSTLTNGFISSLRKGKQILQNVLKKKTINVSVKVDKLQTTQLSRQHLQYQSRVHELWMRIGPRAYYRSLAAQLGRQAAWKAGRKAPLLSFFGFAISQNMDDNDAEISPKIQDFLDISIPYEKPLWEGAQRLSLDHFEFGTRIGQGCNAAVYEAKWKDSTPSSQVIDNLSDASSEIQIFAENVNEVRQQDEQGCIDINNLVERTDWFKDETSVVVQIAPELSGCDGNKDPGYAESDITVISWESDKEFLLEEGAPVIFTVDRDIHNDSDSDISVISFETSEDDFDIIDEGDQYHDLRTSINDVLFTGGTKDELVMEIEAASSMDKSTTLVDQWVNQQNFVEQDKEEVSEMFRSLESSILLDDGQTRPKLKYDLAVKMMFNYDIESNAMAIMKSMEKETIPAQTTNFEEHGDILKNRNKERNKSLPPHPNIVEMFGVFVDPVPSLPDGLINYPAALPDRINPDGIGRNMTMFIVMKRYDMTLIEYLSVFNVTFRERIYLLVQLLEAVDHLYKHGIAHRDMKTDNILVDTTRVGPPQLVLSDFGCCLANPVYGLILPYPTDEIDKGGNTALMAPEIVCAEPGPNVKLDYRKADLWATGAIAYEIFGADNPFYSSDSGKLDSRTYCETELPPLPADVPLAVRRAVLSMLSRDPKNRPSPRTVLDRLYIGLLCPAEWLDTKLKVEVTKLEVTWWIITMATDLILKQRYLATNTVDMMLVNMFTKNLQFRQLSIALQEYNAFVM